MTGPRIDEIRARAYQVPTTSFGRTEPESDGTARWSGTGVVVVEVRAGAVRGLGYTYSGRAALSVVQDTLAPVLTGLNPLDTQQAFWSMAAAVRNLGWSGVAASALSALDIAVTDLKARLLGVSLVRLLGGARDRVMAYGSGGFTNYRLAELQHQLADWAEQGLRAVKMKIGTHPGEDPSRVAAARSAVGPDVQLFVDANGAYDRKQALGLAQRFADKGVTWFEEPVSSDDLAGLRLISDRGPAGLQIAAGEYGYTPSYFHTMLAAGAVDTIQADATRCGGVTGFLLAAAMAQGAGVPISAHTSPAVHASIGAALPNVVHVEYFHDHQVIERRFFDGLPTLCSGDLVPDLEAPGHGLVFREDAAEPFLQEDRRSGLAAPR